MSNRVFITGGTGFIGQHLVHTLQNRGYTVRLLVRPPHGEAGQTTRRALDAAGAELVVGNMHNLAEVRAALRGVDSVFHLAGQLLAPGITDQVYEQLHIEGTQVLLTACSETSTIQRIVHCSTTGVLGPTGAVPADEDAPQRPSNIYERTKAAGEQLALELARQYGLPLVVTRPALVYGPGDLHLLGWFRVIQRGVYRVVGQGDNLLHPIYIDDLVNGLLRCAALPNAIGRVYNLVGERALPIRELATAIATAVGRSLPHGHLPLPLALAIAALLEALPGIAPARLPLTRSRVAFMTESRAYCGARARQELGFVPEVSLATGLAHTVAWYRRERLL
jgi:nucleoside-diphosphate-sugar epimerase